MIADVDEQWRLSNYLEAKSGVLIHRVLEDGPAKQAGLKPGDVLLAVDDIPAGPMNLRTVLTKIGVDVDIELSVIRGGKPFSVSFTLGRRP
jgi:S1-C subfamily serine protease